MKTKLIAIMAAMILVQPAFADCNNKLSWRVWRAQFEQICKGHGLTSEQAMSDFVPKGTESDLYKRWCGGHTPQQVFDDYGYDTAAFSLVWMPELCKLAPRYLKNPPDCSDEAWREWLWLYFYLEGKTPEQALLAEQKKVRKTR